MLSSRRRGILSENGHCPELKLFLLLVIAVLWVLLTNLDNVRHRIFVTDCINLVQEQPSLPPEVRVGGFPEKMLVRFGRHRSRVVVFLFCFEKQSVKVCSVHSLSQYLVRDE